MEEVLRDVPGYSNYEVSESGDISRKERYVTKSTGAIVFFERAKVRPYLRGGDAGGKYFHINLRRKVEGRIERNSLAVHKIVAFAYIPNDIPERIQVNHKDGNKLNNHVCNLEWCTLSENRQHAYDTGLQNGFPGESNPRNKVPLKTIVEIKRRIADGERNIDIANSLGLTHKYISNIRRGKSWGNV